MAGLVPAIFIFGRLAVHAAKDLQKRGSLFFSNG
jgi:hypothetical protein